MRRTTEPPATPMLLTLREAADHLRVSETTVRRIIRAGDLAVVRVRRSVRISTESLQRYIAQHQEEPVCWEPRRINRNISPTFSDPWPRLNDVRERRAKTKRK